MTEFEVKESIKETFPCDCQGHALSFREFVDFYDPRVHHGLDVNMDIDGFKGDEHEYISIWVEFWYGTQGLYAGGKWDRIKGAWRLLRGRTVTFDDFHFHPEQLRELGTYLIKQADRAKELGFDNNGVRKIT